MPGKMRPVDLARLIGVSSQRLSNWESGDHDPPYELIEALARATAVSIDWLLGESVPMRNPQQIPVRNAGLRMVPVFGSITAGVAAMNANDAVEWIDVKDWGGDRERWGRIVDGASMEPELVSGDIVIFEDREWDVGHVVHAFDAGRDTIKCVRRVEGRLILAPTNPEYEPIDAESWHIKGVAIIRIRKEARGVTTTTEYAHGMRVSSNGSVRTGI